LNQESTADTYINQLPADSSDYDRQANKGFSELHIKVLDLKTKSLINATINIFYNSDFIKSDSGMTEFGELKTLVNFGLYHISISATGYFEVTDTIWVIGKSKEIITRDFHLTLIEVGVSLTLNNINFNFNKASLTEESFVLLDKEVLFLNQNPNTFFEIAGHTDSDGPEGYNLLLSQGRAQTVVDYLVRKGVKCEQLSARGYGETRPMNHNKTKSGKANNRRVELSVISMEHALYNL
jgi:outer membrane protein OmpA-like peptidoglycan-associated protein